MRYTIILIILSTSIILVTSAPYLASDFSGDEAFNIPDSKDGLDLILTFRLKLSFQGSIFLSQFKFFDQLVLVQVLYFSILLKARHDVPMLWLNIKPSRFS